MKFQMSRFLTREGIQNKGSCKSVPIKGKTGEKRKKLRTPPDLILLAVLVSPDFEKLQGRKLVHSAILMDPVGDEKATLGLR